MSLQVSRINFKIINPAVIVVLAFYVGKRDFVESFMEGWVICPNGAFVALNLVTFTSFSTHEWLGLGKANRHLPICYG